MLPARAERAIFLCRRILLFVLALSVGSRRSETILKQHHVLTVGIVDIERLYYSNVQSE